MNSHSIHCLLNIFLMHTLVIVEVNGQKTKVIHQTPAFKKHEMFNDIFPLTISNFSENVLRSKEAWIIIFHDGTMLKTWKSMTASVRGVVWVGMVDIRQEKQMLQDLLNIDENNVPNARIYPFGSKNKKLMKHIDVDSPNEAKLKALQSLPDKTQRIFKSDIHGFVLDSYMSHPSRFPTILITDETATPALFKALAWRFEKYYNFGVMKNPEAEDLKALGVSGYFLDTPCLLVLVADAQKHGKQLNEYENLQFSGVPYNKDTMGEFNFPNLMKFLFAINYQFRHALPGDNHSDNKIVAEMLDIIEIEKKRFEIMDDQVLSREEL
ncbi:uncharacterized protein LOC106171236 [Lingula anatina]|uniref:Uncharacterized protein LOC106171236 n=1 Tax=Lingula anatina TaxID=7574 RepID=A0A1S3J9D9_LINAN|nr:uncharacterized protein LOC106171236 [Lingula anatina]|eukprot:XP_013406928.1 uncharacterized protein LOC106171236 [Lingula anatina]